MLSLAMIVKNEEHNIGQCLASVRGLVDEVIVVDTGSTDATTTIASGYGARIFTFPWCDDYSAARNESLSHCSGDWILVLDADEVLDARGFDEIRKATTNGNSNVYSLPVRNYCNDGAMVTEGSACHPNESGDYPEYKYYTSMYGVRLFRASPDVRYKGRLHESIEHCFNSSVLLMVMIHHFGKLDMGRELRKREYYLRLAMLDLESDPTNGRYIVNAISQARIAGDWKLTHKYINMYISRFDMLPSYLYTTHGECLHHDGMHVEAVEKFNMLLSFQPDNVLALNRIALPLAALGRVEEACDSLKTAIKLNPKFVSSYLVLADIEMQLGNHKAAWDILNLGLEYNPGDPRIAQFMSKRRRHDPVEQN